MFYVATYQSRHFTFDGCGETADSAVAACVAALDLHGKRCQLPSDWWHADFGYDRKAAMGDDAPLFSVREYQIGKGYVDQSPI